MTKSIDDMSLEEIRAERKRISAERDALAAEYMAKLDTPVSPVTDIEAEEIPSDEEEQASEVEPWPHEHMTYAGLELQVRRLGESGLIAIAMAGVPALGPQGQMRIFTQLLTNHLSPTSFITVVEAMTNPDSGVDIEGLVNALTKV